MPPGDKLIGPLITGQVMLKTKMISDQIETRHAQGRPELLVAKDDVHFSTAIHFQVNVSWVHLKVAHKFQSNI